MPELSDRQRRIREFIRNYFARNGCSPSQREIAGAVGLQGVSAVNRHLKILKDLGHIDYQPGIPRSIKLLTRQGALLPRPAPELTLEPTLDSMVRVASTEETVWVQEVGRIAAGTPIVAEESPEATWPLPRRLVGQGEMFLLKVEGQSMVNAGILDGDWVVVRRQDTAEDRDIVVARIEDEATVKVLRHHAGHVWLMPRTADPDPIPGDNASVLGIVVAVLRSLRPTRSP